MHYLEISDAHHGTADVAIPEPIPGQVQNAVKQTASCPTTARAAAVTAVYVEQTVKKRRASSLIVSGLPIVNSATDVQQFTSLCQSEFGIQPDIVTVKRLGSVRPGRVQPLLVALRTDDAASHILSRAKNLRQSADDYVKNNVYVNPNLTRAEASAAYLLRQKRRQKQQSSTMATAVLSSTGTSNSQTGVQSQTVPPASMSTNLNAGAVPYQPTQ